MWWTLLKSNWKIVVISLAFVVSNAWSLKYGIDLAEAEAIAALSRQRQNNLKINSEVSDELSKKYSVLRRRYNELVSMRAPSGVRVSDPARGGNGATGGNGLHGETGALIIALALQADLQTQQLIACQNWIREQSK